MTQTDPCAGVQAAILALEARFGSRLSRAEAVRAQHGSVESWLPQALPDAVLFLQTTEEVSEAVTLCHHHGAPVIPFGAGSSIEGQVLAPHGGISFDLSGMDRVLAVNAEDMDCVVQCGVIHQNLNEHLRATGLFFPVDLGAHATLGGMASTRASGTTTVRYGSMRELVLGLTVVMPDGRVIRTGGRARKSASGYDLTHLFVGAEGTLGIITEVTLRLFGRPEASRSLLCAFEDLEAATSCVVAALQSSLGLTRIELADTLQMQAINAYSGSTLPERPTLWVEITGSAPAVAHDATLFAELAEGSGALHVETADNHEAANRIWRLRHNALYATRALRPGIKGISTDVCVPISRLPDCLAEIRAEIDKTALIAPLIGHAGDGNFHLVLMFDPEDAQETAVARQINARLISIALTMGGTATGEHGVGLGKMGYMQAEHGAALDVMRQIKRALDPSGIMNPGKIFTP